MRKTGPVPRDTHTRRRSAAASTSLVSLFLVGRMGLHEPERQRGPVVRPTTGTAQLSNAGARSVSSAGGVMFSSLSIYRGANPLCVSLFRDENLRVKYPAVPSSGSSPTSQSSRGAWCWVIGDLRE